MTASIAERKKFSDRSENMETIAIAATTLAEIEEVVSQRSLSLRSLQLLESGFHMIAAIAEHFFFSAIAVTVATIWKPGYSCLIYNNDKTLNYKK